jgi:hypothetical protein
VLAGVRVEHEIDQRALQLGAHVPVEGKRAPVILAARSKSRMPSSGPRSQCALGFEIELPGLAHAAHFDVVVGVFAHRHGFMRHVGNAGQQLARLP